MVEAVASTRLATVLPKVEAALRETSLFPHLVSFWKEAEHWWPTDCLARARIKKLPCSQGDKTSHAQHLLLPCLPSTSPRTDPLPFAPNAISYNHQLSCTFTLTETFPSTETFLSPFTETFLSPFTETLPFADFTQSQTPPPNESFLSPSIVPPLPTLEPTNPYPSPPLPILPNPKIPQPITSPNTSQLVQILNVISKAEVIPPPPPQPIFAAMGGYLTTIEAAAIARMQLKHDQHMQQKTKRVRIARNGPRRHAPP